MGANDEIIDVGMNLGAALDGFDKLSSKTNDLSGHMEHAAAKGDGFFGGLLGGVGKVASLVTPIGLLGNGVSGLVGFFKDGKDQADQWNTAMAQTDAVLKSTGGSAGVTKQMVSDLASTLSAGNGLSTAADDAVASGENLLLTFTGIGKDVFPKATQTMLDMSQAMGTDMKGTAIQLGKALNDPAQGMSALSRVGVTFTDEQKKTITTMEKMGNVSGAQGVILNELGREFGGSALAGTKNLGGQMTILHEKFANVVQSLGDKLMPTLSKVMGFVNSDAVMGALSGLADMLGNGVSKGIDILSGAIGSVMPIVSTFFQYITQGESVTDGVFQAFSKLPGPLQALGNIFNTLFVAVQAFFFQLSEGHNVFDSLGIALQGVGPALMTNLGSIFGSLLQAIGDALPGILAKLGEWGTAFINWVAPMIPPLLGKLIEVGLAMEGWMFGTVLPAVIQQLGKWAAAFIGWIGPMIPPFLQKLADWAGQAWTWLINTGLPTLIQKLGEWSKAFVDWIGPMIPPFLAKMGDLLGQLGSWLLNPALPSIIAKLAEWGGAFVSWIGPKILPLLGELGKLLIQLGGWLLTTALPAIIGKLAEWGGAFLGWVAKDVLPKLPGVLADIWNGLTTWIGQTVKDIGAKVAEIGTGIINGIKHGIENAWNGLVSFLSNKVKDALPQFLKDWLGIKSPSTVTIEIGRQFVEGFIVGMDQKWGDVRQGIQVGLGGAVSAMSLGGTGTGAIEGIFQGKGGSSGNATIFQVVGQQIKDTAVPALQAMSTGIQDVGQKAATAVTQGLKPLADMMDRSNEQSLSGAFVRDWDPNKTGSFLDMMATTLHDMGNDLILFKDGAVAAWHAVTVAASQYLNMLRMIQQTPIPQGPGGGTVPPGGSGGGLTGGGSGGGGRNPYMPEVHTHLYLDGREVSVAVATSSRLSTGRAWGR